MKEESIKIDCKKIKKISLNLLEKINAFFIHRENIAFLVFIISLAVLTRFIDIPHSVGIKLTSIWLLLFLGYFIIFELEKTERFLINKITWILVFILIVLLKFQDVLGLENKDIFYMIGAIFAFWYGYKKYERDKNDEIKREESRDKEYERDKELEILEKYTSKYDEIGTYDSIKNGGEKMRTRENKDYYKKILNIWYEEFYLHKKGYLNDELWNDWSKWIYDDLRKFLHEDYFVNQIPILDNRGFIYYVDGIYLDNSIGFTDFIKKLILKAKKNEDRITKEVHSIPGVTPIYLDFSYFDKLIKYLEDGEDEVKKTYGLD